MAYQTKQSWTTSEAKNKFAKMLRDAQNHEQVILRYGKSVAIVVAYEDYLAKSQNSIGIWDLFQSSLFEGGEGSSDYTKIRRDDKK